MTAEKIQFRPLANLFLIQYKNFIKTGTYNLSPQMIPQFIEQINIDIAVTKEQIKKAKQILKIEKLPPLHKKAIKINAYIEDFNDDIKKFRKRKTKLINLRDKPPSKKSNQIPISKSTIVPPLARPMIKETSDENEN
ncbi:MAG: hypothetical protein C3F06_07295 [Candidatus Methanoperedenaceae archaeon]|nr:MAG: hypothetical protein C3F06_07295 [Candidatus Methanoperedenaceae archaeon]